ncbi:MAG: PH domain-containing protein [Acidobacteria bacterium]|nr:PH domain-containing protein [Acidobacteriota bacterium]
MSEVFKASRLTKDNRLFPTVIEVSDQAVLRRKRSWFTVNEMSIHLSKVASVRIDTGLFFADVLIESSGGSDAIKSHGHSKGDARRMKELIEQGQGRLASQTKG